MVSSLDGIIAKKDNSVSWFESTDNYEHGIAEGNAEEFMKTIADLIMKEINKGGAIDYRNRINSMSGIGTKLPKDGYIVLDCLYASVEYNEKVVQVNGVGNPTVSNIANRFEKAAFIKPLKFSGESEVRLYFCPVWKSQEGISPIPFFLKPLLLDCERLLHLVSI